MSTVEFRPDSLESRQDSREEWRQLIRRARFFLVMCLAALLINGSIYLQISRKLPFETIMEWLQDLFLLVPVLVFGKLAAQLPKERTGLLLICGFFLCMLIREQDEYLNYEGIPGWEIGVCCVLLALLVCIVRRGVFEAVYGLNRFARAKAFPVMCVGLVVVLLFSRLFGMHSMWRLYFPVDPELHFVCRITEEGTESLGYAIILMASWYYYLERRRGY